MAYNYSVNNKQEDLMMFFEQDVYEEIKGSEDQQANYIFALGYAMIRNEIGQ